MRSASPWDSAQRMMSVTATRSPWLVRADATSIRSTLTSCRSRLGDRELFGRDERHALCLLPVAERGVEDFDEPHRTSGLAC